MKRQEMIFEKCSHNPAFSGRSDLNSERDCFVRHKPGSKWPNE